MNKIILITNEGYGIRTDIKVIVQFNENPEFNELIEKNIASSMTEKDYTILEKYTRNVFVLLGLVNYVGYVIFAGTKRLSFRTSKKARYKVIDISNINEDEFNKRYRRLKPIRVYTVKLSNE